MAARYEGTGSTDYLRRTTNLPTSTTFTACCFYYHREKDTGSESTIIALENAVTSPSNSYTIEINNSGVGTFAAYNYNVGTGIGFNTLVSPAPGTWYFCFITGLSGTSYRAGLINLSTGVTEIVTHGTPGTFTTGVLNFGTNGYGGTIKGRIAGIKAWDASLTNNEILQEARSLTPVRTANINLWCPVIRSGTDRVKDYSGNARDLTQNSITIDEDGPPVSWGGPTTSIASQATENYTVFKPTSNTTAEWSLVAAPTLVSSNLIARYMLNEASSGSQITQINSTVNNYHLDEINYNSGQMVWTQGPNGNRGLRSTTIGQPQYARRKVTTGDALITASGGNKWTWEIVVDGSIVGSANNDRIVAVHRRTSTGTSAFSIAVNTTEIYGTGFNNSSATNDGQFLSSILLSRLRAGRNVIHLVIDSTISGESSRDVIYLNGNEENESSENAFVTQNSTLAINTDYDLIFFNRADGVNLTRSPNGILYYAALYNKAFTQAEVTNNYNILNIQDDIEPVLVTANYQGVSDTDENGFSDYVEATVSGKVDEYKFTVPAGTTIKSGSSLKISYSIELIGSAQVNVAVYQGTTLIKSTPVTTLGQSSGTITLTPTETANITDFSNLSLRITSA
jgi:hypothetical protein